MGSTTSQNSRCKQSSITTVAKGSCTSAAEEDIAIGKILAAAAAVNKTGRNLSVVPFQYKFINVLHSLMF
jgi:hypothetical protein